MKNGIDIDLLPTNIQSAAYVTPSNQFPTGTVMPIGERYKLLDWAMKNNSFVIEDDYDSELRYFGKPIPALKGLDDGNHVVYLGSFFIHSVSKHKNKLYDSTGPHPVRL